jgi:hypothetical protein
MNQTRLPMICGIACALIAVSGHSAAQQRTLKSEPMVLQSHATQQAISASTLTPQQEAWMRVQSFDGTFSVNVVGADYSEQGKGTVTDLTSPDYPRNLDRIVFIGEGKASGTLSNSCGRGKFSSDRVQVQVELDLLELSYKNKVYVRVGSLGTAHVSGGKSQTGCEINNWPADGFDYGPAPLPACCRLTPVQQVHLPTGETYSFDLVGKKE